MITEETGTLLVLLIILFAGLVIPELFKKIRIPFVTSLIIIGAVMGPYGLNYIETNQTIEFFGFLGMTFLMFMAGLDTNLKMIKELKYKVILMSGLNIIIPFIFGLFIVKFFGYSWFVSFLIGVIFVSSSAIASVPFLEKSGLIKRNLGQIILSSILIADITSLVLLSFSLQEVSKVTILPLSLYFFIIFVSVFLMFFFIPKIFEHLVRKRFRSKTYHEKQLRFVIVLVISTLLFLSLLGAHPILAAFIIGMILSKVSVTENILTKFHTLGYGLFVPVFFFILGMKMDLSLFAKFGRGTAIISSLCLGLIISKFGSGYLAGRLAKLSPRESSLFGSASIIHLTTTLAVVYIASNLKLLDSVLISSIIFISIITTFIGPIILGTLLKEEMD
ncbi:hypothetical protein GF366_02645 [Candidatus Peregrinibacteria bacterium]|nr:hypothetical protein [Candidatus Peregrinibacteria bacterium]